MKMSKTLRLSSRDPARGSKSGSLSKTPVRFIKKKKIGSQRKSKKSLKSLKRMVRKIMES
jgi:hypothetical protein